MEQVTESTLLKVTPLSLHNMLMPDANRRGVRAGVPHDSKVLLIRQHLGQCGPLSYHIMSLAGAVR